MRGQKKKGLRAARISALFSQNLEEGADIRQAGVCHSLDKSNIVAISDRWGKAQYVALLSFPARI